MLLLFSSCLRAHGCVPKLMFDADTGGGGGGGSADDDEPEGGDPSPNPDEKKYSDKDMSAMVEKRLKATKKELKAKADEIAARDSKLADLEAQIAALGKEGDLDAESKKRLGSLELEKKRFEVQIAEQNTQIKALETKLDDEFKRRRQIEKDQVIDAALAKIQCIDPDTGRLIFRDKVAYDEEEECWLFTMRNGNPVDVEAGITAECPDYLKPASMRGGSGTPGGNSRKSGSQKKLDELKSTLADVTQRLRAKPSDNNLLTQFRRLGREIKTLEASAK